MQEGELERVGEEKTRKIDVRVIAATNRDLKKESGANRIREDLYFRLNVFPIHSPALGEREGDIGLLAMHFVKQINIKQGDNFRLRQGDIDVMEAYDWPGDIRELQNVIERAAITSNKGPMIFDFPLSAAQTRDSHKKAEPQNILSDDEMQAMVKANMLSALKSTDWKLIGHDGAAALLEMKPTTLTSRIKRMGLRAGG